MREPGHEPPGLVGIGLVGTAIAEHLLARGFGVVGFDIDPTRSEQFATMGGQAVKGPAEVGGRCRRVFLSLMTTEIVREVVEGTDGLLSADEPPRFIVDTTTGDPDETVALAERLTRRDVRYLDATISGSSRQIRSRQAVMMVGGERGDFETCADLLDAVSDNVVHVGPTGSGVKAKLASNLILGLNRLALAEGLVFADKLGLELKPFLELLKITPAYSAAMDTKGEKMLAGDFTPEARVLQHHKDVTTILRYAEKHGQELLLTRAHIDVLQRLVDAGHGSLDNSAVIKEIRRRTGSKGV